MDSTVFFLMAFMLHMKEAFHTKMLDIEGLEKENLLFNDDNTIIYKFKENDTFNLKCINRRKNHGKFQLTWFKSGVLLTCTEQDVLEQNFLLQNVDDNSSIECRIDEIVNGLEDASPLHEVVQIKLVYSSDVTSTPSSTSTSVSKGLDDLVPTSTKADFQIYMEKYALILGGGALIAIIVIIILLYLTIKHSGRHQMEDQTHLRTANALEISQSFESVTQINPTYSSPRDAKTQKPIDVNVSDTYSTPFSETCDIYSVPIPKEFRSTKPKAEKTRNNYYTYATFYRNGYNNCDGPRKYESIIRDRVSDVSSSLYGEVK